MKFKGNQMMQSFKLQVLHVIWGSKSWNEVNFITNINNQHAFLTDKDRKFQQTTDNRQVNPPYRPSKLISFLFFLTFLKLLKYMFVCWCCCCFMCVGLSFLFLNILYLNHAIQLISHLCKIWEASSSRWFLYRFPRHMLNFQLYHINVCVIPFMSTDVLWLKMAK